MNQGATTVRITGSAPSPCERSERLPDSMLRRYKVAFAAICDSPPDAIVDPAGAISAKPAVPLVDHWTRESFDPIERIHDCVALTLIERAPTEVAELATAGATAPTWTFTRGGTVTVTVCVRLTDDACWPSTGSAKITLPSTNPVQVRRNTAIDRVSSYRELYAHQSSDFPVCTICTLLCDGLVKRL